MTISKGDFDFIANYIYQQAAIVIEDKKTFFVDARMSRLASQQGLDNVSALVAKLKNGRDRELEYKVIDAMTTNETFFFRDARLFEDFRQNILPYFIKSRAATRTLNIWCAACSSGQEPYSVAMTLLKDFPQLKHWKVRIIASDISNTVLEAARNGTYTDNEIQRGLPDVMLKRFFTKNGSAVWQVKDELRRLIEFRRVNLVEPLARFPSLDIVFVRNVLIYFDTDVKRNIVMKISKLLRPDGVLFLGTGETTTGISDNYEHIPSSKAAIYQLKKP